MYDSTANAPGCLEVFIRSNVSTLPGEHQRIRLKGMRTYVISRNYNRSFRDTLPRLGLNLV